MARLPVLWLPSAPAAAPARPAGPGAVAALLALVLAMPVAAVPPPPPLAERELVLTAGGPEQPLRDTVRAYQGLPVVFEARAGDVLQVRLADASGLLVLQLDPPDGLPWFSGAKPGPDGLRLTLGASGRYRLVVLMSGDAARSGRALPFELGLRLLRR